MYVSKLFCGYKRQRNEGEKVGSEKYYNDLYPNGKKSPIFSNNEFSILVFLGLKMQDLTVRYPCFSSFFFLYIAHSVWKSQKKSHSTLRAKRATPLHFEWPKVLKLPKTAVNLASLLKNCDTWGSNSNTRQVTSKWTKMPKKKYSNATFWMIFKHCAQGRFVPPQSGIFAPNIFLARKFKFFHLP